MPLTPEEIAQAEALELAQSDAPPVFNPLRDLSAEDIAALAVADKNNFVIADEFNRQPELHSDPKYVQKVADAFNLVKQRGFKLEDLPTVPEAGTAVGTALKGLAGQVWNYANVAGNIAAGAISEIAGAEDLASGYAEDINRRLASNIAGTEEAVTGLSQLAEKGVSKAARGVGASKGLATLTPQERVTDLFNEAGRSEVRTERLTGKGEVTKAVTGGEQELDPEEVATLAAGDPLSFFVFGKAAQLGGNLVSAATPAAVKSAVGAATRATQRAAEAAAPVVGGRALQGAANVAKGAAKVVEATAPTAVPIYGALEGAATFGPAGAIGGLTGGRIAGKAIARGAGRAAQTAERIADVGKQIAGATPITSAYAQGARDVLQALPSAAGEVAKGTALDVGLAAATAELPQDTQGAVGFGAALGAIGGAQRIAGRVLSGQLIGPREYGINTVIPSSGQFPTLDTMHSEAFRAATPGVRGRLNAVRQFVEGAAPGTDVFLAKDPAAVEAALVTSGLPAETAKAWSQQSGFLTTTLPGKDGSTRRVAIVRDVDAAPHEAFHAVQDVLGEEANQRIDSIVRETYAATWDNEGRAYAARLGGDAANWRETILDASGWGLLEAKEKIFRDQYNRVEAETGAAPSPRFIEELAKAELGRVMDEAVQRHPNADPNAIADFVWRDILTPEDITRVSDRYIAREIAAENFDALLKNQGPRLQEGTQLPQRLARILGGVVSAFGGEPLAGRTSEFGQVPLSTPVVEAVRGAAGRPEIAPAAPAAAPAPRPVPAARPGTPEAITTAAEEARTLAQEAPAAPLPGGTRSPRELLGEIAESIATQSGVRINYLSAPGEPAAATSSNRTARRAIIEAFRTMPAEARSLWEKTFFPERVTRTRGGKYQIQGWAPEVFASNAHKLAEFLVDVPDAQGLVPYAVDPATRSFTPDAWRQLYQDTQTFVQNQMRGQTGAGDPLVVPRSVTDAGGFAPPTRPGAVALDQGRADFINMLFNFRLPDTPRVQTGRRPLNIIGQEVSVETLPGRVEVPVRPRGEFTGEEAARQGIEGRQILEVNPLRNQIEAAAQQAGKAVPSFVEAIQRLNLENIKEVQGASEVPQFRGNTLTLTAGFQPATAQGRQLTERGFEIRHAGGPANPSVVLLKDGSPVGDISAVRRTPAEADIAFINVNPQFRGQGLSEILYREIGKRLQDEGVDNVTGMIVNPRALSSRTKVFPETEIESIVEQRGDTSFMVRSRIPADAQFSPSATEVLALAPEEFSTRVKAFTGPYGGGLTGMAFDLGAKATTPADVAALRDAFAATQAKIAQARASRDIDTMFAETTRSQFFREAIEAATGTGPSEGFIQKNYDPNFKSPMKGETATPAAQAQPKPSAEVRSLAEEYARKAGLPTRTGERKYATAPEPLLKEAADFYQEAVHAPDDAAVVASYDALTKETADQYQTMVDAGYTIEPWRETGQPYADSAAMVADVRDNKHLYYFPSDQGFGTGDPATRNLMMDDSGVVIDGENIPFNDLFRAVHDFFGHAKEGYQFGPRGEFNAWGTHSELYSPEAQGALAAETLAQNAFVNFGPHMRTESGAIRKQGDEGFLPVEKRPFAEQKNVVVPSEIIERARAQFAGRKEKRPKGYVAEEFWIGKGAVHNAEAGHENWAVDYLQKQGRSTRHSSEAYDDPSVRESDALSLRDQNYDALQAEGFFRGVREGDMLRIDATDRLQSWEDISPATRRAIEDAAVANNLRVEFDGEEVMNYVNPPDAQFAPRKKKAADNYKFKPPGNGFSKAWILPSGEPVQLGGQWHHQYLADNPEVAAKYKLTIPEFEGTDVEGVREAALKAGFGRINYGQNTGTLTVEARARDWRKIKGAVERMVESNLDNIDNMTVHLLNETATGVVDSQSARLFNYDDFEKLQHIPFITEGEPRAQFSAGKVTPELPPAVERRFMELGRLLIDDLELQKDSP